MEEFLNDLHRQQLSQERLEDALLLGVVLVAAVAGSETIATLISNGVARIGGKITRIVQ